MNDFREPHPAKNLHLLFGHVWYWYHISKISRALHNNLPSEQPFRSISHPYHQAPLPKNLERYHHVPPIQKFTEHPPFPNGSAIIPSIYSQRRNSPRSWIVRNASGTSAAASSPRSSNVSWPHGENCGFLGIGAFWRPTAVTWCLKGRCLKCVSTEHQEEMVIFDMCFFLAVAILTQNKVPGMWIDCSMLISIFFSIHKFLGWLNIAERSWKFEASQTTKLLCVAQALRSNRPAGAGSLVMVIWWGELCKAWGLGKAIIWQVSSSKF